MILSGLLIFLLEIVTPLKINNNLTLSGLKKKKNDLKEDFYFYNTEKTYNIYFAYEDFKKYLKKDFSFVDILLFFFLNIFYIFYIATLPIFWIKTILRFLNIFYCMLRSLDSEINKPDSSNLELKLTFKNFFKHYFFWLDCFSYIVVYFFFKKKNKSLSSFFKNLSIIYLVGRPLWYINFCINTIFKLKKILNSDMWARKKKLFWIFIFYNVCKNLIFEEVVLKTLVYYSLMQPLKLSVINSKVCTNGIESILSQFKSIEQLLIYNRVCSVVTRKKSHVALINEITNEGIILTSQDVVKTSDSVEKTIIFKKPNENNSGVKQYIVFSEIEPKVIDNSIPQWFLSNFEIKNTADFFGLLIALNLYAHSSTPSYYLQQSSSMKLPKVVHWESVENNRLNSPYSQIQKMGEKWVCINNEWVCFGDQIEEQKIKEFNDIVVNELPKYTYSELNEVARSYFNDSDNYMKIFEKQNEEFTKIVNKHNINDL